jgi:hypothetical protein
VRECRQLCRQREPWRQSSPVVTPGDGGGGGGALFRKAGPLKKEGKIHGRLDKSGVDGYSSVLYSSSSFFPLVLKKKVIREDEKG